MLRFGSCIRNTCINGLLLEGKNKSIAIWRFKDTFGDFFDEFFCFSENKY